MSKKDTKEEFKDGVKKGASFWGIHSVGDFFKVCVSASLSIIRAILKMMVR